MPGAFAHMIAADLAKTNLEANKIRLPTLILNRHPQWLQAGAVGPDYPYLHHVLTSHDKSDSWADILHYTRTGDVVRTGVKLMRERYQAEKGEKNFQRALAWLYGYSSHVILDASIHPVVRSIVGEYEDNKPEHRTCEMYMDSYIYKETYAVELDNSEWSDYLRALTDGKSGGMDESVVKLWDAMLLEVYPEDYAKNPPLIHEWHKAYVKKLDSADVRLGFFRHMAAENGFVYALSSEIPPNKKKEYIDKATVPEHNRFGKQIMRYEEIFDFGVKNVAKFWKLITETVEGAGDTNLAGLLNWNLDKGTVDPKGEGDATLWV
ncbi:MAG: zinc dependent phospholipase C family protein [Nitrospirae bacterium]|nr:zinc dependent phospholipase C family protein [Nitrospirota bacterium]